MNALRWKSCKCKDVVKKHSASLAFGGELADRIGRLQSAGATFSPLAQTPRRAAGLNKRLGRNDHKRKLSYAAKQV